MLDVNLASFNLKPFDSASSINSSDSYKTQSTPIQQLPCGRTISSLGQQSCQRNCGSYLQHRVAGVHTQWKRHYFRLRKHRLVCFPTQNYTMPLFKVIFTSQSVITQGIQLLPEAFVDSAEKDGPWLFYLSHVKGPWIPKRKQNNNIITQSRRRTQLRRMDRMLLVKDCSHAHV